MQSVDKEQFTNTNKKLFQKDRWFLFLDSYGQSDELEAVTAHRCASVNKREWLLTHSTVKSKYDCCLVVRDGACQDCGAPVPESILTVQVLFNGAYRNYNGDGGFYG